MTPANHTDPTIFWMRQPASQPHPTVQLLHELPDGTRHVDWLIAQDPRGRDPLVGFRVEGRVDELAGGHRLGATRMADHRPAYLDYEGPISGDRGVVKRLARGTVVDWERSANAWTMDVRWETGPRQRLTVSRRPDATDGWIIEATPAEEVQLE